MVYSTDQVHYSVRSLGRDGTLGPADVSRSTRDQFDNDLTISDGCFTASPEIQ